MKQNGSWYIFCDVDFGAVMELLHTIGNACEQLDGIHLVVDQVPIRMGMATSRGMSW